MPRRGQGWRRLRTPPSDAMIGFDYGNWLMVFLRASALLTVFPLLSARNFPVQLRLALGMLLAALVSPTLPPAHLGALSLTGLVGRMAGEVLAGLALGFASRIVFYALDMAGALIANEMGLNLPAGVNPFADAQNVAPGLILYYLAAMIFLSLDLHHWLLLGFQRSYTVLPVGGAGMSEALVVDLIRRTNETFGLAIRLAAPFIGVSFIVTTVFSVLGRAVSQMNVFSEMFAIRTLAGLTVFGLSCQLLAQHIMNYLRRLPEDVLSVAQLLGAR